MSCSHSSQRSNSRGRCVRLVQDIVPTIQWRLSFWNSRRSFHSGMLLWRLPRIVLRSIGTSRHDSPGLLYLRRRRRNTDWRRCNCNALRRQTDRWYWCWVLDHDHPDLPGGIGAQEDQREDNESATTVQRPWPNLRDLDWLRLLHDLEWYRQQQRMAYPTRLSDRARTVSWCFDFAVPGVTKVRVDRRVRRRAVFSRFTDGYVTMTERKRVSRLWPSCMLMATPRTRMSSPSLV